MAISFFNDDILFNLPQKRKVKNWITLIVQSHNFKVGDINIIFCSENKILEINNSYLDHNYYTDIITFPYIENKSISSDIYISIPTVKSNSVKFNQQFSQEILRVIIHGILHLIGYCDNTEKSQSIMRDKEDESIKLFYTNYA